MSQVVRREAARRDLVDIVYHYISKGSPATARRFRDQAEATFRRLAGMPGMGTRYETTNPAFGAIRYVPFPSRFKMYLVFYRPIADGVEFARVLHGARDIHGVLSDDFGVAEAP